MMVAQVVDLTPGDFVHTFGDLHLYKNHLEQAHEQLSRECLFLPRMKLNPAVKNIHDFKFEDFELLGPCTRIHRSKRPSRYSAPRSHRLTTRASHRFELRASRGFKSSVRIATALPIFFCAAISLRAQTSVEIDLEEQMAYLLQNGRVALASPISSGRYGHLTEKGSFSS